jgi:ATP-binding cassette subfamily B multidrug efflux pump
MIISDLMKMIVVLIFMFYMNWKLTWIVIISHAYFIFFTRIFQRKMQVAFEEVRNQIANMNTFVQERVTGMKIVQLLIEKILKLKNLVKSIKNTIKLGLKPFYTTRFFPYCRYYFFIDFRFCRTCMAESKF